VIKAVLFDLDGTLLEIELDAFLRDYFGLLGPVVAELVGDGLTPKQALGAVLEGTNAMSGVHPDETNREVFEATFRSLTGFDLGGALAAARLEAFYREEFPSLKAGHGPAAGGVEAVSLSRGLGLRTALATNPIFPLAAIQERARWAALELGSFDMVTSYETMIACKPTPGYYLQVAESLGVNPQECLMVGDDPELDLPAAEVGMKTFYVGPQETDAADWSGSLLELQHLLPNLAS
jgi:FMN phosphatase YigB (HAD superfamily)